ncbi:hypothetical protein VTI28DRAFT_9842 [Corynascus sepedonium]
MSTGLARNWAWQQRRQVVGPWGEKGGADCLPRILMSGHGSVRASDPFRTGSYEWYQSPSHSKSKGPLGNVKFVPSAKKSIARNHRRTVGRIGRARSVALVGLLGIRSDSRRLPRRLSHLEFRCDDRTLVSERSS